MAAAVGPLLGRILGGRERDQHEVLTGRTSPSRRAPRRRVRRSCGASSRGETARDDGSQNGIHTIRSSDGGGLTQITSNPGGDDAPGSWSANGKRIVFQRFGPDSYEGVFVVNVNGTGLKRILPPTVSANCCTFSWSPQGNEIAFSRHVTPDVHSSLWVMHSDGSGLRPLTVPPS